MAETEPDTTLFDSERPWLTYHATDHASYSAEKDYDAADYGPVETDPAVVEALLQEQLEHLKETGFY